MFGFLYWSSDFLIFLSYLALWFSFISSSLSFCSVFWEFPWLSHFTLEFLLLLICRSTLLVSNGPFSCILSLVMDAVSNTSFLLSSVFLFFVCGFPFVLVWFHSVSLRLCSRACDNDLTWEESLLLILLPFFYLLPVCAPCPPWPA